MTSHVDDGLLQDFQEGLLPPEVEEEVSAHLAVCSRCRGELEALADLLDGIAELPQEAQPSRDLWPQIGWRIAGERVAGEESGVGKVAGREGISPAGDMPVRGANGGRSPARRVRGWRFDLPAWQLLAAGIVVALVSGGSVWAFLAGRGGDSGPAVPPSAWMAQPAGWQEAYGGYDEAVSDLEAVLEQGRHALEPETVRVLEENLATIDRAIQDAREALAADPGSAVVRRILAESLRWKVNLLRHAVSAVYSNT
jgi:hypothetical protein